MGQAADPWARADICVYSKVEIATVPPPRTLGAPDDRKDEESIPDGREQPPRVLGAARWPPKVPDAVEGAPNNLYLLPWFEHLPWLEPAAAEALREKKKVEREVREEAVRQAFQVRRG